MIFLVSFALALWRAASWLDWGVQPAFIASALKLSPGPATASSIFIIFSKLAGSIAGPADFGFSQNIAVALLFALSAALSFITGRILGRSLAAGAAAALIFLFIPEWKYLFDTPGHGPFVVFFSLFSLYAATRIIRNGGLSAKGFLLFAFLFAVMASQHIFLFALCALLLAACVLIDFERLKLEPGRIAPAAFAILAGVSPLLLTALRPRADLVMGSFMPSGIFQALNIPGLSGFGNMYLHIPNLSVYYSAVFRMLLENPYAPYFPIFALTLIGTALIIGGAASESHGRDDFFPHFRKRIVFLLPAALAFLPLAIFLLSPSRTEQLYITLLLSCVSIAFAAAAGEIIRLLADGSPIWLKKTVAAAVAVVVAAALFPVLHYHSGLMSRRPGGAIGYAAAADKALVRDAVVFLNTQGDPLLSIEALAAVRGTRPDIVKIYPDQLSVRGYRDMLRKHFSNSLKMPTEDDYNKIKTYTAKYTKPREGTTENETVTKRRTLYNLTMLLQQTTAVENSAIAPVYFDTIQRFLKSREFNRMCFNPVFPVFQYRACDLAECVKDILAVMQKSGNIKNLPGGKAEAEKAIKIDSAFLAEFADGCDAGAEGFSTQCMRAKMRAAKMMFAPPMARMKRAAEPPKPDDYRPLPEITEVCFQRQHFLNPRSIASQWFSIRRAGILDDPRAAEIVSNYFADVGEHAYIHNDTIDLGWLFQTAAYASPANARAHLFLLILYENTSMHDKATVEADTLFAILSETEKTGALDDYYYYMLQDLYTKIGRPADAEKYRKLTTGEE